MVTIMAKRSHLAIACAIGIVASTATNAQFEYQRKRSSPSLVKTFAKFAGGIGLMASVWYLYHGKYKETFNEMRATINPFSDMVYDARIRAFHALVLAPVLGLCLAVDGLKDLTQNDN